MRVFLVKHLQIDQFHIDEISEDVKVFESFSDAKVYAQKLYNKMLEHELATWPEGNLKNEKIKTSAWVNPSKTFFQIGCDEDLTYHQIAVIATTVVKSSRKKKKDKK